ncbi:MULTISPECIES: hypothetical protein [Thermoactinomyces]|jgi:hypothetical protein|uniref:Uncharacterized protein n=1 Tax=Thermoactinomyces vulgaris TaxID=2026 RepID=A0ABS0QE18_THEVU|nr:MULTISPECIES: hypothetical protein [Thermoactinomyces]MBA4550277.1 hypothetical protein [Thermoactinomyces vulgaris]MBA4595688.1 hypothetical protein [Thermoactinomyces vulgaris]MBH8582160.1 hypothetical protein [Thermoactinomyces sp. CICC 10735]MBH8585045.1 hypothetical protein [Thermoactinomyces sp. CICC 10520]MBH8587527.1 hypothetical protein [Thermoactinomyces vulgaris]
MYQHKENQQGLDAGTLDRWLDRKAESRFRRKWQSVSRGIFGGGDLLKSQIG